MRPDPTTVGSSWLRAYRAANREVLAAEPEFAEWLNTDYVPMAGGWQY